MANKHPPCLLMFLFFPTPLGLNRTPCLLLLRKFTLFYKPIISFPFFGSSMMKMLKLIPMPLTRLMMNINLFMNHLIIDGQSFLNCLYCVFLFPILGFLFCSISEQNVFYE